jgi:hypothetical protein
MIDEDVEGNEDGSISSKVFPSDASHLVWTVLEDESQLNSAFGGFYKSFAGSVPSSSPYYLWVESPSPKTTYNGKPSGLLHIYTLFITVSSPSSLFPLPSALDSMTKLGNLGGELSVNESRSLAKRQHPGKTTRHQPEGGLMAKGNVSIGTERTPLLNPSLHFLLRRDSRLRYLYHNSSDEEDFPDGLTGHLVHGQHVF